MQALNDHLSRDGFRLRGTQPSRLDGFSDVVFGFALTLIVVSLEVPKNFSELHQLLRGFFPFALTFLMLMLIWYAHYRFFRRYGLHDIATLWLNGLLLFFILFYVYPLKFMFAAMFNNSMVATYSQLREMTLLYAAGFTAVYTILAALYANALRRSAALQLSPLELALTRIYFWEETSSAAIGLLVCILAFAVPQRFCPYVTLAFVLIVVPQSFLGRRSRRVAEVFGHVPRAQPGTEI